LNELSALEMVVACLAVTLGYTVFGMTGFGANMVALPVLAHVMSLRFAVPMLLVLDLLSSTIMTARHRSSVDTGELKRLLTGPIESEITGITESYDGKALFINIQHPGEDTAAANIASPNSSWPYSTANGNPATPTTAKSARPRSATIVLTRIDGGVIGTDFSLS
jgi:hypothetical protein